MTANPLIASILCPRPTSPRPIFPPGTIWKMGKMGGNGKNGGKWGGNGGKWEKWGEMGEMRPCNWSPALGQQPRMPISHSTIGGGIIPYQGHPPITIYHYHLCGQHSAHLLAIQPLAKPMQATPVTNREHNTQIIDIGAGTTPLKQNDPYALCVPSFMLY